MISIIHIKKAIIKDVRLEEYEKCGTECVRGAEPGSFESSSINSLKFIQIFVNILKFDEFNECERRLSFVV